MKIKTVCELTDLSDRAIRHYIEEGLIAPDYSENYLGRRSFDFTQADVRMLKDIAILRKFDFSIPEIKQVQANPWNSWKVIQSLRERKSKMIQAEQAMMAALSGLEDGKAYTIEELARALSAPVTSVSIPAVDEKRNWKRIMIDTVKAIVLGVITWLPLLWVVEGIFHSVRMYYFPVFRWEGVFLTLLTLIPTALVILISKFKTNGCLLKALKYFLLFICLSNRLIVLNQAEGIFVASKTENIVQYQTFDARCYANKDEFFRELFPQFDTVFWGGIAFDKSGYANYYYYYTEHNGYMHDIYAEWRLDDNEFIPEIIRIEKLFEKDQANHSPTNRRYVTFQKGDYTCIAQYYMPSVADDEFSEIELEYLFDSEKHPMECYMFAYNEKTQTVRYIYYFDYRNGTIPPHYLELDW